MTRPLYGQGQPSAHLDPHGHRGLWFDRFFDGYPANWQPDPGNKTSKEAWAGAKIKWVNGVAGKVGDRACCEAAVQRLAHLCSALGGKTRVYGASWHFATGLGNPHPVENGFLWHPSLGTPYIPGSAVKGLVRSWVEAWMELNKNDRLPTLHRWFGSEHKDPKERKKLRAKGDFKPPSEGREVDTEAGTFIFFDALPISPVTLKADIMTPHMGKWYEEGGDITALSQSDRIPADWHDPVPVCFLVADKPQFQFAVAPRTDAAKEDLPKVIEALGQALEWLGAGAKTAVGYGTMTRDAGKEDKIRRQIDIRVEVERERTVREAARAAMDPFERGIADFLDRRSDKNQSEISALIGAVKQGKWTGSDKVRVAVWLKKQMEANNQWKTQTQAKNPERDRQYQNTLLVSSWLEEGGETGP